MKSSEYRYIIFIISASLTSSQALVFSVNVCWQKKKIIWNIFKSVGGSIFDKLNKAWTEMLADAKIYGANAMYKADLKTFEKIKVGLESIIDPSSAGKNSLSLWIFLDILWSWDGSHLN